MLANGLLFVRVKTLQIKYCNQHLENFLYPCKKGSKNFL